MLAAPHIGTTKLSLRFSTLLPFSKGSTCRYFGCTKKLSLEETAVPPYKILFAGSDIFSCASLEALAYLNKELVGDLHVLVGPDKRTSRGLKGVHRPLLRLRAEQLGLKAHVLNNEGIRSWQPAYPFSHFSRSHLLITASFGSLIPSTLLDLFGPLNALNVHPSLLPKYRGAAPIQWSIANGERETGVSVQSLSRERFDEGRILAQKQLFVSESATFSSLEKELAHNGARLLVRTVESLAQCQAAASLQEPAEASRAPKIVLEHAHISWQQQTAAELERRHRAFSHQFPLWTTYGGKRLQLLDVHVDPGLSSAYRVGEHALPGTGMLDHGQETLRIVCSGGGVLSARSLKTESRKAVAAKQWWIGTVRQDKSAVFGT